MHVVGLRAGGVKLGGTHREDYGVDQHIVETERGGTARKSYLGEEACIDRAEGGIMVAAYDSGRPIESLCRTVAHAPSAVGREGGVLPIVEQALIHKVDAKGSFLVYASRCKQGGGK